MEFNFLGIDKQKQYNYMFPTSSSSNYTYISDQPMIHGGRSVVPVGFPSSLMVGQPLRSYRQFEPEMWLHGERFLPYDATVSMPLEERYYGGEGYDHRREITDLRRRSFSGYDNCLPCWLGNKTGATMSGSKRKAPLPSSPTVAGSSGLCSKKVTEEWRCAVCDISATCERALHDHLQGKKHLAKIESLKCNNTSAADIGLGVKKQAFEIKSLKSNKSCGEIGLGIKKVCVKNQTSEVKSVSTDVKKVKMKKKFKFWCKTCKIGAYDEVVMKDHKKGKKHVKNRRMIIKARAQKRSSERKGI
ncbi:putative deoxyribodipyrimidine photo-lyase transcription factor C2H2 family [Helianthus annuus]|nr:putative deoxyribodipyrimidine photo-lyase transcription factor C2H2 family [Helianthus annuus]